MSSPTDEIVTREALADALIFADRRHPDIARALQTVLGPEEGQRRLDAERGPFILLRTSPGVDPVVVSVAAKLAESVRRSMATGTLGRARVVGELLMPAGGRA